MLRVIIVSLMLAFGLTMQSQIDLGGGVVYGTELSKLGLNINGQYEFSEQIDGSVNLNFFLPEKEGSGEFVAKTSIWSMNFDGHYKLQSSGDVTLYPLAGINITVIKFDINIPDFFGQTVRSEGSDSSFGLNIGGGAELEFSDKVKGFSEIKYVLNDVGQVVFGVGVLFAIN